MTLDLAYLRYPLPPDVQRLFEAGDFARMEQVIEKRLADPRVPKALHDRLRFQLAIARELPAAYPFTQAELLARLQERISGFREEELEDLRDDGTLDWRYIDGVVRFKNNCISSLLKTRPEYVARAINPEPAYAVEARKKALNDIIDEMKRRGHAKFRVELHEEMSIESDRLTPGETLHIHLPLPVVDAQVKEARLLSTTHTAAFVAPEDEAHRSVYFELPYEPGMTVGADMAYVIDAPYVEPDPAKVSREQPSFDTEEVAPHIVFTPYLRALAKEIVGDETNPLKKARLIYNFITTQAVYRFMPPYLTVTNIPEYFCSGLRGDCGVQALTFITLCRLCGIPARWQAGLYTPPSGTGNHDWARFYAAPYGWLFADCSFGGSAWRAGDHDRWNFYFGNLDPWRLPLCRDFQQDFNPPKKFLRCDPYDNQNGEAETLTRGLTRDEIETDSWIIHSENLNSIHLLKSDERA